MSDGSGLPMPRRRTFTAAFQASVHSMLTSLRHPWLRLSAHAGSRGMGSPEPPLGDIPRWSGSTLRHTQRSAAMAASRSRPIVALAVKKAWFTRDRSSGFTSACSQTSKPAIAAQATQ